MIVICVVAAVLLTGTAESRCPGVAKDPCLYPASLRSIMILTRSAQNRGAIDKAYNNPAFREALPLAGLKTLSMMKYSRNADLFTLTEFVIRFCIGFFDKALKLVSTPSSENFNGNFDSVLEIGVRNSQRNNALFAEFLLVFDRYYTKVMKEAIVRLNDLYLEYPSEHTFGGQLDAFKLALEQTLDRLLRVARGAPEGRWSPN